MAYRTIKSPEISGSVTINEAVAISLAISHRQKPSDFLFNAKSGNYSKVVRNKRWFISKSEMRRLEKKKAIRRLKRRSLKDVE